jgi:hypothetical protein
MDELTSTVQQMQNARQANRWRSRHPTLRIRGGTVVDEVVHTMHGN